MCPMCSTSRATSSRSWIGTVSPATTTKPTEHGGPRAGGVILTGDHGPIFSHSFATLHMLDQVVISRDGEGNRPPRGFGSGASPLMKLIDGSHYGAKSSRSTNDGWSAFGSMPPPRTQGHVRPQEPASFPRTRGWRAKPAADRVSSAALRCLPYRRPPPAQAPGRHGGRSRLRHCQGSASAAHVEPSRVQSDATGEIAHAARSAVESGRRLRHLSRTDDEAVFADTDRPGLPGVASTRPRKLRRSTSRTSGSICPDSGPAITTSATCRSTASCRSHSTREPSRSLRNGPGILAIILASPATGPHPKQRPLTLHHIGLAQSRNIVVCAHLI